MEGYRTDAQISSYTDDPGCGIIPRALHHVRVSHLSFAFQKLALIPPDTSCPFSFFFFLQLFELLEGGDVEFTVRVSFLEIYNEELFDLLSPTVCLQATRMAL